MPADGLITITPTSVSVGVGTATINANGSISIASSSGVYINGVFSDTYDSYMVTMRTDFLSVASTTLRGYMTQNGVLANGVSTYNTQRLDVTSTGSIATSGLRTTSAVGYFGGVSSEGTCGTTIYFFSPWLTQRTVWRSVTSYPFQGAAIYETGGCHTVQQSYDGFYIEPVSGTVDARITVYGFNQ